MTNEDKTELKQVVTEVVEPIKADTAVMKKDIAVLKTRQEESEKRQDDRHAAIVSRQDRADKRFYWTLGVMALYAGTLGYLVNELIGKL